MRVLKGRLCLILTLSVTLFACGGGEAAQPDAGSEDAGVAGDQDLSEWPEQKYLSCEQVRAYQVHADPRMLPLNVVDEEFYDLGHLEGSLIIPWDLLSGRLHEVDPQRHVVIYCRRGVRSESAYATLQSAGYERLWIMESGIERWLELGYPSID